MEVNDFMLNLVKNMINQFNITESSANLYLKSLYNLNNKKKFNNLAFLRKTDDIHNILKAYAPTTQKLMISAAIQGMKTMKGRTYKKYIEEYESLADGKRKEIREKKTRDKTKKQEQNWLDWDEILHIKKDYKHLISSLLNKRKITENDYKIILNNFVLALYTDLCPRRNLDYLDMVIVNKYNDDMDNSKNYLSIDDMKLIFNVYKTSKKYGKEIIDYSDNDIFQNNLSLYLRHHPSLKKYKKKNFSVPLLVKFSGEPFTQINSITRILNKIFDKKIGATMLRSIYHTSKFGDVIKDMENTCSDMAHSVPTAINFYVKNNNPENKIIEKDEIDEIEEIV